MRRYIPTIILALVALSICGCAFMKMETEKIQDIEYKIISQIEQPEEIQILIEENKESLMKMSYVDQGLEYIVIGYGEQETSGYSVVVLEVYETENTICICTNLVGPSGQEEIIESPTYPYIVICIEENEKPIVYD